MRACVRVCVCVTLKGLFSNNDTHETYKNYILMCERSLFCSLEAAFDLMKNTVKIMKYFTM